MPVILKNAQGQSRFSLCLLFIFARPEDGRGWSLEPRWSNSSECWARGQNTRHSGVRHGGGWEDLKGEICYFKEVDNVKIKGLNPFSALDKTKDKSYRVPQKKLLTECYCAREKQDHQIAGDHRISLDH